MALFLKIERRLTDAAMVAAILFLVIGAFLAMYQVTMRFVFDSPSTWSEVITRSTMIWAVFLGAAPAFRQGSMISIDVIQTTLPRRAGMTLFVVANLLSLLFFIVLFWQGVGMTLRVMSQTLAALEVSIAWAYAALPVGSVFTIIAILGRLIATDMSVSVRDSGEREPS